MPVRRALGITQYKAPPPGVRSGNGQRGSAQPAVRTATGGEGESYVEDEFASANLVAEVGYSGYSDPFSSDGPIAPPPDSDDGPPISDSAEAAALSDARNRGENVLSTALRNAEEETSKKKLPELRDILPAVPEPLKEALEDIFRAKWTKVVRVKKRDLFVP